MQEKKPPRNKCAEFTIGLCEETTVHGVRHLVNKHTHVAEKVFWLIFLVVSVYGAIYICMDQYGRYKNSPIVMVVQTNWRDWPIVFPGITTCFINKVNKEQAIDIIRNIWGVNSEDDPKFSYYMTYIRMIANITLKNLPDFSEYDGDKTLLNISMLDLACQVYPKTSNQEIKANDQTIDEDNYNWYYTITERGVCSVQNAPISILQHCSYKKSEVHELRLPYSVPYRSDASLNYATYEPTMYYLHSPYEVMSFKTPLAANLTDIYYYVAQYDIKPTTSSDRARALRVDQRKCVYTEEEYEDIRPFYSPMICQMTCRAKAAVKECGCRPFFYHFIEVGEICNVTGMVCLSDKSKAWETVICECPRACTELIYTLSSIKTVIIPIETSNNYRGKSTTP